MKRPGRTGNKTDNYRKGKGQLVLGTIPDWLEADAKEHVSIFMIRVHDEAGREAQ